MSRPTVCAWLQEDGTICIHQQPPDGQVGDPCIVLDSAAWKDWATGLCELEAGTEPMVDLPGKFGKVVEP